MASLADPPKNKLINRSEAAELLGTTVGTLNVWACRGKGPAFVHVGRAVRYRMSDLEAYINANRSATADQK